ncbi:PREDICTED: nuclear RNA export factor 1-like isoform X2 [Vollenhovia emeryi]|nr:PREDICTED: nuclear RNA export factor 1-like isoform X2 [Vollenhovia emeryi]
MPKRSGNNRWGGRRNNRGNENKGYFGLASSFVDPLGSVDSSKMPKRSGNNRWGGRRNNRGNENKGYFGHDDRTMVQNVGRDGGPHVRPTKHRVSFKTLRPNHRDMSPNLILSNLLDEDIPMADSSNNNTRQVIMNQRDRDKGRGERTWHTVSRGRNSPMPNRNFKGGQADVKSRVFPLVQSNWYKIIIPPPSQRMFVSDPKIQEIASQFLQQYFTILDSDNRQPLLDAYAENACLSLTISNFYKLNGYYTENRNIFRTIDSNRRHKLLKQGRLPVVSFISEMPKTRHLLNTFTMDITLATQAMMFITITGYFQELDKDEPIRYFNRTFIIVPEGEGCCIRNEQWHISQPSEAQLKQLHQQLNQLRSQPQPQTVSLETSEVVKQQMTVTLSQQTSMNLQWSLKCLQETQWNYDNALSAFHEFFKRGQIPSEAFTK